MLWAHPRRLPPSRDQRGRARCRPSLSGTDRQGTHGGAARRRPDEAGGEPELWAGVGLVRPALFGDPDTVVERIDAYRRLGIDTFILSGYPHGEEAYSFGEQVLPRLPLDHDLPVRAQSVSTGPFGETIAGSEWPKARAASAF